MERPAINIIMMGRMMKEEEGIRWGRFITSERPLVNRVLRSNKPSSIKHDGHNQHTGIRSCCTVVRTGPITLTCYLWHGCLEGHATQTTATSARALAVAEKGHENKREKRDL